VPGGAEAIQSFEVPGGSATSSVFSPIGRATIGSGAIRAHPVMRDKRRPAADRQSRVAPLADPSAGSTCRSGVAPWRLHSSKKRPRRSSRKFGGGSLAFWLVVEIT
jgi:hypothetical protein